MGGKATLTAFQEEILGILQETGGLECGELKRMLAGKASPRELETQFAILTHMERARAERNGDHVVLKPW